MSDITVDKALRPLNKVAKKLRGVRDANVRTLQALDDEAESLAERREYAVAEVCRANESLAQLGYPELVISEETLTTGAEEVILMESDGQDGGIDDLGVTKAGEKSWLNDNTTTLEHHITPCSAGDSVSGD